MDTRLQTGAQIAETSPAIDDEIRRLLVVYAATRRAAHALSSGTVLTRTSQQTSVMAPTPFSPRAGATRATRRRDRPHQAYPAQRQFVDQNDLLISQATRSHGPVTNETPPDGR